MRWSEENLSALKDIFSEVIGHDENNNCVHDNGEAVDATTERFIYKCHQDDQW